MVNDGSGTIAANGSLYVFAGVSFLNAGSLGLNDDSGLYGEAGTPSSESESGTTPAVAAAVLTNTGSITVTSATSYPASIGCSGFCGAGINDKGTITVSSGELELGGSTLTTDTVDTGTVLYSPSTVDSGATLSVPSGSSLVVIGVVVIDSGGSLSAPGSVTVNGTLTVNQNTTLPNLTVSGTLGGTASVTISGSLTLDGTIGGPGTVTVASAGSLDVSESSFVGGGSLVNDGSGTIAANASLYVFAGASFLNAGSLGLNDDSGLYGEAGTPSSESESGTTPAVAAAVLTNTGSITVTSATSYPASIGCSGFCGAGINDKGTITVSSGELELGGSTLTTDTVDTGTVLYSPSTVDSGPR